MDTKTLAAAMGYTDKQVKNVQAGGVSDSYIQEQITNNPTVASKVTKEEVNTQVNELLEENDKVAKKDDLVSITEQVTENRPYIPVFTWKNGKVFTSGTETVDDYRIITNEYIHFDEEKKQNITIKAGYRLYYVKYTFENDEYTYVTSALILNTSIDNVVEFTYEANAYYRFNVGHYDTTEIMNVSDADNAVVFGVVNVVDKVQKSYTNKLNDIALSLSNFLKTSAKTPLITWIDDDTNNPSDGSKGIQIVKNLCDELGIKCTFACITKDLIGDTSYNTNLVSTLLDYQKNGFNIVSHSVNHDSAWQPSDSNYSLAHIEEEITESIRVLKEKGFIECDYIVTPYGTHNDEVQEVARKWCKCLVNAGSTNKYNRLYENGRYDVNRIFIKAGKSLDEYKSIIDNAIINGDWIVFGTHSGITSEWDSNLVKEVLQYAISKNIRIATLSEAMKIRQPIYNLQEMFN